ncbi:MAG: threonine dehydratase [Alphaproteobacteria bacterium]|nr:threonine dehydratase [Alphaproteobacteria bacterium]
MTAALTLDDLRVASELVYQTLGGPTPAYAWPLLARRAGCEVWVKHENHTPIGAFKVRGGLVYMDHLARSGAKVTGVISATRGNHGQSIALAARKAGLDAVIYVPQGNSTEKNAAMAALGAELVEHGRDFDEAKHACEHTARERGLHMVPSFDPLLVKGVATYGLEFFQQAPDLDVVYVPIGMGSGICGTIAARDALGLSTEVVGVVAEGAPAVALSFEAGRPVPTNEARTFADGMACREPHPDALDIMMKGAARIVRVSDEAIADAIRFYYEDTHNLAEGAGAAGLAALMAERDQMKGRRAGVILSGGNIDRPLYGEVLAGRTPGM